MDSIVLEKLNYAYGDKQIFKNVDFSFKKGKFTLFIGDTGSGKSTLFKLITQLEHEEFEGNIIVEGKDIKNLSFPTPHIGMLFQDPNRQFTMSTLEKELIFSLENLCVEPDQILSKLNHSLELTDTYHIKNQSLHTLSGGEKQRAALAVAIAMGSDILLLDEPFASVDHAHRKKLIYLLNQLKQIGKTIIVCDHDLSDYAEAADEIVLLQNQRLSRLSTDILTSYQSTFSLDKHENSKEEIITLMNFTLNQERKKLIQMASFQFFQGITLLTGDNGTGKTSFFKSLVKLHPYKGTIHLFQQPLKKNKPFYQKISLVVQEAMKQFLYVTPAEELATIQMNDDYTQTKLVEVIGKFPFLSEKNLSLYQLSGGQKKIVQLIVMLSLPLPCLLMDEPFAGLDEETSTYFVEWIREKRARFKQSFLIISHRLAPLDGKVDCHIHLENLKFRVKESE